MSFGGPYFFSPSFLSLRMIHSVCGCFSTLSGVTLCFLTIKSKSLRLSSSSGASLKLVLDASSVTCSSSSGANINLSGSSDSFESNASSGSHIKARDLTSKTTKADVSSGAGISLHASEELNAHASSGGNISYEGKPGVLNKSKSSGGSISQR